MARLSRESLSTTKPKQRFYKPVLETLEDRYLPTGYGLALDFGTTSSPLATGYQRGILQNYTLANGYGWQSLAGLQAINRNTANALTRDLHQGRSGTYEVSAPNGNYNVTIEMGDAGANHPNVSVWMNGQLVISNLSTSRGQFVTRTFPVQVSNGLLTARLSGNGKSNSTFALVSLQVAAATANTPPTDISLSNASVGENLPVGTLVATLTTADLDTNDSFTYSLVSGTGSTDNTLFTISGNHLLTNSVFSYATQSTRNIRLRTTDAGGLWYEKAFTISILPANHAPTDIQLSNSSIVSNQPVGSIVGALSTTDSDLNNTFTYTLVSGTGSTDNGRFSITGNQLDTAQVLSIGTYSIRVRTTDQGGLYTEKVFSITATDGSNPLNKPVVSQSDIHYLGSFYLPQYANGWSTAFSNGGLAYRYVNGNLQFFTTSHVYSGGLVYEFNYPGLNTNGVMPVASVVHNWGDVYTSEKWVGNDGGTAQLSSGVETYGLYYDQSLNRLYWSYGHWYNATNPNNPSIGYSVLNDATGAATGIGAWSLTNRPEKFDRGGLLRIPQWFANSYTAGKTLGVGFGGYFSIISTGSFGPALAAISDPNIAVNPDRSALANVPLVGYPSDAPDRGHRDPNYTSYYDGGTYPTTPGAWNPANGTGYWTWSDIIYGAASWIDTSTLGGVLYVAKVGTGNVYYQTSDRHASGSAFEWMVYDPRDLAAVASGAKQQWQIQPKYEWIDNSLPVGGYDRAGYAGDGGNQVGGVTFDPTTNRLYVLVNGGYKNGVEWYPEMYVYQIGTGAPNPTILPGTDHFQFGATTSPTVAGYTKITSTNSYNPLVGYGLMGGDTSSFYDGTGSTLTDGSLRTADDIFAVNLPNGTYHVTLTAGDPATVVDSMGVMLQGQQVDTLNTAAGQSVTRTYTVTVTDGMLRLEIRDLGGITNTTAIQALDIVGI